MKRELLILMLAMSQLTVATSLEPTDQNSGQGQAFVYTGGVGASSVRIDGEAARVLFESLEVQAEGRFGFIQTQTKSLNNVVCVQSILGDVPGQMSKSKYICTIIVNKK